MTYSIDLLVPYLGLPVKTGQKKTTLEIFADNKKIQELEVAGLQEDSCDYYCWLRLSECVGKTITLKGNLSSAYFALVQQTDCCYYDPLTRPLLHFTAERGWLNDPNGLVYHDGIYHLYFQYNPADSEWGNMSWGHAESTDLLHFRQVDTVLLPDENGAAFSGSGLVNERGLLGMPKDALIFFYTAAGGLNPWSRNVILDSARAAEDAKETAPAGQAEMAESVTKRAFTQRIAVSLDGGRTLNKLPREAVGVLSPDSRDPQVFWHEASGAYVMALWIEGEDMAILRSDDLQNWELTDHFTLPGAFECPNLFCLPLPDVNGAPFSGGCTAEKLTEAAGASGTANPAETTEKSNKMALSEDSEEVQWVLIAADGSYYFGDFDGYRFASDGVRRKAYLTELPYAAQIYNGLSDRSVLIPWLRTKNEGKLYTGAMGLPKELGLIRKNGELMLQMSPVREYENTKKKLASLAIGNGKLFSKRQEGNRSFGSGNDRVSLESENDRMLFEAKNDQISFEIKEEAVTELVLLPETEGKFKVNFFGRTLTVDGERLQFGMETPSYMHTADIPAGTCFAACAEDIGHSDIADEQTILPESFAEMHILIDRQMIEVYGNDSTMSACYETGSDRLTGKIAITGFAGKLEVFQWK